MLLNVTKTQLNRTAAWGETSRKAENSTGGVGWELSWCAWGVQLKEQAGGALASFPEPWASQTQGMDLALQPRGELRAVP